MAGHDAGWMKEGMHMAGNLTPSADVHACISASCCCGQPAASKAACTPYSCARTQAIMHTDCLCCSHQRQEMQGILERTYKQLEVTAKFYTGLS